MHLSLAAFDKWHFFYGRIRLSFLSLHISVQELWEQNVIEINEDVEQSRSSAIFCFFFCENCKKVKKHFFPYCFIEVPEKIRLIRV